MNNFIPMNDTHNKTNTTGRNHRNTIVSLSEKKMDEMNELISIFTGSSAYSDINARGTNVNIVSTK